MNVFHNNNSNKKFSHYSLLSICILLFAASVYFINTYHYHIDRWDDAYITFRFAQHLAEGQGLIWNIGGERVEGFTSLLHVLLLSAGIKIGINPWLGSLIISIVSVLATIGIMLWIVWRQVGYIHPLTVLVIGIYLIDSVTAIHTTSGLETQLFVAMLCACFLFAYLFIESSGWLSAILLGVFIFLSCLCRPEAVIYGLGTYFALAVYCLITANYKENIREKLAKLTVSSGIVLFCGLSYVFWKWNYFGYILPNPYYVKSNKFSFAGIAEVTDYLKHLIKYFVPLLLAGIILFFADGAYKQQNLAKIKARIQNITSSLSIGKIKAKILLLLTPPVFALAFYTTIIHEVGGGFRFSYPTYFYFVLGIAVLLPVSIRLFQLNKVMQILLTLVGILLLGTMFISQKSWRYEPLPESSFNQYHFKIAYALKETNLGSNGTVLCDAAGIIPYISGFNQVDRVGLVDNYLSGRKPMTPFEREQYIWSRPLDVYVGYEPPAQIGAETPEEDPQMKTQYVSEILLHHQLKLIESRIFVQDPQLLHSRMRELRDNWYLVGEMDWDGWDAWKIKSFIYVKRNSPFATQLISSLNTIIKNKPEQINLNDIHTH
jgi:hypothetical protein